MGHPCRCLSVCRLSGLDVTLQLLVKVLPGTGQDDHHHLAVLLIDAVGDLIIGLVVVDIVAINSRQKSEERIALFDCACYNLSVEITEQGIETSSSDLLYRRDCG